MRTFTANFTTQASRKDGAKPYYILEIDWGGTTGTKYYLDRTSTSFEASGMRVPSSGIGNALVMQWPSIGVELNESQVGATAQTTVVLNDASGEITSILNLEEKQRKLVTVWRLFDDASTVWPTDAALMATFSLRPFDWSASDNTITLNLGDLGPLLAKSISFIANNTVFTSIPVESRDKQIPLCWGLAQRVEALLVSKPWETTILQGVTGSESQTVKVDNHPSEFGIADGAVTDAWLGLDKVSVTWHQSSDPDNVPSTVTVSATGTSVLTRGLIYGVYETGTSKYLVVGDILGQNSFRVAQYVLAGDSVMYLSSGAWATTTVASIQTDAPWPGFAKIVLSDSGAMASLTAAMPLKFLMPNTNTRAWPPGTVLKALNGSYIYAANALPSKGVIKVEGYGTVTDDSGTTRKGFITLGQFTGDNLVGGVCTPNQFFDPFTTNLNDSTWAGSLGNNITTITFSEAPRLFQNTLDDNRIWVTLFGVEDAGNSTGNLITIPSEIIKQYLTNPNLMNVSTGSIDLTSFSIAATALSGYYCGFAQLEATDGLQLLQDIARQCNSCLFFDQGKATIAVLSDTPGTIRHTFDTTTNDNLLQGQMKYTSQDVADVVNDLTFKWRALWDDISGNKSLDAKEISLTSQAAFGRIAKEIPVYIYFRRGDVVTQLDFWLAHWASIWRTVTFTAFLDALILQPGDWIDLIWIDGGGRNVFGGTQPMQVTKTVDTGKDGLVEITARYVMYAYS